MSVSPISSAAAEDSDLYVLTSPESRAERVRRMQANARALAREQIEAMSEQMGQLALSALEVADGGEAYPIGVRELSRRIARELDVHIKTIDVLLNRP
jgi:hypothetical protein